MNLSGDQFGGVEDHGEFRIDFGSKSLEVGGVRLPAAQVRRQEWSRSHHTPVWNADVPLESGHLANLELQGSGPNGPAAIHASIFGENRPGGGRELLASKHWYHNMAAQQDGRSLNTVGGTAQDWDDMNKSAERPLEANADDLSGKTTLETLRHWGTPGVVPQPSSDLVKFNQQRMQQRSAEGWKP